MSLNVRLRVLCAGAAAALLLLTATANAGICIIGPAGDLPPDCPEGYLSPSDVHMIIDGLPAGSTIELDASHNRFFNISSEAGGTLGGERETFLSFVDLHMQGTGEAAGYVRNLTIPNVQVETHIGPRNPSAAVQSFDTDMFSLIGQLPPGDPDFDLLRITAGTGNGLPSPGHTTLTRLPSGDFNVDSFFDITYEIEFVGAPGGPLGGLSGSTTGTIRMQAGVPEPSSVMLLGLGAFGVLGLARRSYFRCV